MRNYIFLLIFITTTSCLDKDALDANKYDNLVITPNVLIPFVQVDLSSTYYSEIYDDPSTTETEVNMIVDVFKDKNISDYVTSIDFNFTAINGYPINFDLMNIYFLSENGDVLETLTLNDISSGVLSSDGSLESATIEEFQFSFDSSSIAAIMNTRSIKVVLSWKGNTIPYALPHPSFYFNTYSDITLKTDIGK